MEARAGRAQNGEAAEKVGVEAVRKRRAEVAGGRMSHRGVQVARRGGGDGAGGNRQDAYGERQWVGSAEY